MRERKAYKIYSLEDWRREKRAGETWGVRTLRLTAIVWVPVVGLSAAVFIKAVGGTILRIILWGFTGSWRAIFH